MKNNEHKYNISSERLNELKTELEYRKNDKRLGLKENLGEMIAAGDISENEGYSMTLDENENNERKIAELEDLIANAILITKSSGNKVALGSKVTVKMNSLEKTYYIVGESEANPLENKLSTSTPIGRALLAKKVGDSCKIQLPMGEIECSILKIE